MNAVEQCPFCGSKNIRYSGVDDCDDEEGVDGGLCDFFECLDCFMSFTHSEALGYNLLTDDNEQHGN